ncbi:MAG: metallophosphoesterase [Actinomycetes bacterium]
MPGLFVVSDIHGYLADLRDGLRGAGLLGDDDTWTGGDAELWLLGDMTDRGPDGIGVVDLMRGLQEQAPDQVHVLMGNHEALAVGRALFPDTRFTEVWRANGGLATDQAALTPEHLDWLRSLPVLGRSQGYLMMHSDTLDYLEWGESVDDINATVTALLGDDDAEAHWEVFAMLTSRYGFAHADGADAARDMLSALGGECIVHGHSIIGSLVAKRSEDVEGPMAYADGLVVAVDGGRYDGGPLLVVQLA